MRYLVIGSAEQAAIAAAIERAKQNPVPIETILEGRVADKFIVNLEDRKPGFARPPSEIVPIPHGYRAAISFEHQPAGLCRHLSVSVDIPGKVPNVPAVDMIAEAFGFSLSNARKFWLEEFEPGHMAVNVVQLEPP